MDIKTVLKKSIRSPDVVLYHGTSIESLNKILRSGRFYEQTDFTVVRSRFRRSFSRRFAKTIDEGLCDMDFVTLEGALEYSSFMARAKAFYDHLRYGGLADVLRRYDEAYDNMFISHNGSLSRLARTELIRTGRELGHKTGYVKKMIERGLRRRGAVIGIDKGFLDDQDLEHFALEQFYLRYPTHTSRRLGMKTNFIGAIYIPKTVERQELLASLPRSITSLCARP